MLPLHARSNDRRSLFCGSSLALLALGSAAVGVLLPQAAAQEVVFTTDYTNDDILAGVATTTPGLTLTNNNTINTAANGIAALFDQVDGAVINNGGALIEGSAIGILFQDGGEGYVRNAGVITGVAVNGIQLDKAGVIINLAGGTIEGGSDGVFITRDFVVGTGFLGNAQVTNDGSIVGLGLVGASMPTGGYLTNSASGAILGYRAGVYMGGRYDGIYQGFGTVENSGSITGSNAYAASAGVRIIAGGAVTNRAGGAIEGAGYGILGENEPLTVENLGRIAGSAGNPDSVGLYTAAGGDITNRAGGVIEGADAGLRVDGGYVLLVNEGTIVGGQVGLAVRSAGSSLVNRGRIEGGANSLQLGAGDDRVALDTGSDLVGVADGGGGSDTLATSGTVTEDESFVNFDALEVDSVVTTLQGESIFLNKVRIDGGALVIEPRADGSGGVLRTGYFEMHDQAALDVRGRLDVSLQVVGVAGVQSVTLSGTLDAGAAASLDLGDADDAFILETGGTFTGLADGGPDSDSLTLRGTGREDGARFVNFERLLVEAGADRTLTGTGVFAEAGDIFGRLLLEGSLTSAAVTVGSGGSLEGGAVAGGGLVTGDLFVEEGGRLAPGGGIATFTVSGNATFRQGSFFVLEADGAPTIDLLKVTGSAALEGGTVQVSELPPLVEEETTFLILDTDGGVTGEFATLEANFALFDATLEVVNGEDVVITLVRNDNQVCFDRTPNRDAVVTGLESGGGADPLLAGVLGAVSVLPEDEDICRALDSLSGDVHPTAAATALNRERDFLDMVLFRSLTHWHGDGESYPGASHHDGREALARSALAAFGGPQLAAGPLSSRTHSWGLWGAVEGLTGGIEDENAGDSDYSSLGATFGADYVVSETIQAGGALGFAATTVQTDSRGAESDLEAVRLALYARHTGHRLMLDGGLLLSVGAVETQRQVAAGALSGTARGETDSFAVAGALYGGYGFAFGPGIELVPLAGLSFARIAEDGFTESGAGDANLEVGEITAESLRGKLGLRLSRAFGFGGTSLEVEPELRLAYEHEFLDSFAEADLRFAGAGPGVGAFALRGAEFDRDLAKIGAAVTASTDFGLEGFLDYEVTAGAEQFDQSVVAGARLRW